ncbi:MAG TPA: IPT/TIG domain-containing protein [Planctomycetota bacterium]|nr:IPT/TIG domain-containing protein [Planctomycetota bacterium]
MRRPALRLACLALLAVPAAAQIARSPQTRLLALTLDGAGGSAASVEVAAHVSLGDLSGGQLASNHYRAVFGFLAGNDPHATTAPVVFGVQPPFGPLTGGQVLTLTGLNFDNFRQGDSLEVSIGGRSVGDVSVHSSTLVAVVCPPGEPGPADVVVTSSLGTSTAEGAFTYIPAIATTPVVRLGGEIELRNWGPPGDSYVTLASLTPWSARTRFGPLLIGPIAFQLMPARRYPAPDGLAIVSVRLPDDDVLAGLTFYFQSLDVSRTPPFGGTLTNASTVTVP